MNLFARLARHSFWLLSARLAAHACSVIVTYLLARRLGIAGFGEYSFVAATIMIGNTLTTFGSDMYLIREIASRPQTVRLSSALVLQLVLSCMFIAGVLLFAPFLPNQTAGSLQALRVYSLALIPLAFFTVFTSALRGWQKMESYAWLNLGMSVLQAAAISLFIPPGSDVAALAFLLLVLQTAGAIFAGTLCAVHVPDFWPIQHFSLRAMLDLFIVCFPMGLIAVLGILYQKISLPMLLLFGNASMAGWFSAAARAVEATRLGHVAAFTALYPAMANPGAGEESARTFKISLGLLVAAAFGLVILLVLFAEPLVHVFFGAEYQPSVPVLKILCFSLIPYVVNTFLLLALLAERREKIAARVLLASLGVLLALNLWFIPRAGQAGAAWAVLLAEIAQSCLLLLRWKTNPVLTAKNLTSDNGAAHELPDLPRQI